MTTGFSLSMVLCGHFNNPISNSWFAGLVTIIHLKGTAASKTAKSLMAIGAITMLYDTVTLMTEAAVGFIRCHMEP
ncbi:hypothetical protein BCT92_21845 [Vibrio sp. 10N.261.52.E5]|nr:hypothetical protein BCT92_21845 [Vibrio sp. 10N.261.52.E5]PMO06954.1 hypothetical protein BCT18_09195 [Vibrio cyclitrophicus]